MVVDDQKVHHATLTVSFNSFSGRIYKQKRLLLCKLKAISTITHTHWHVLVSPSLLLHTYTFDGTNVKLTLKGSTLTNITLYWHNYIVAYEHCQSQMIYNTSEMFPDLKNMLGILSGENFVETVSLNEYLQSCPPKLFRKQHKFNLPVVQYRWKVTIPTHLQVTYHYYVNKQSSQISIYHLMH